MHLSPTRASIKIENCTTLGVLPVSATRPRILSRQSFNRFWMKFIARALAREYCRVIYLVDKLPRLLSTKKSEVLFVLGFFIGSVVGGKFGAKSVG